MNCNQIWLPVDGLELIEDRGWDLDYINYLVDTGCLKEVWADGMRNLFESPQQRKKFLHLRRRPASAYRKAEQEHLQAVRSEYGDVYSGCGGGFQEERRTNWFGVIMFILEILMLPFAILGMRDGAQWFLGTGEYAKGRDDLI